MAVDPKSESFELRTKYYGEQAVRDEFPEAIILRCGSIIGNMDNYTHLYVLQKEYFFNMIPIYSNLTALRQPIEEHDVAMAAFNAIKIDEAEG